MARLVIIGIDSMDRELVTRFAKSMPNITRIVSDGDSIPAVSTIPPDSVTAWATIYTGKNPAEHGMVSFADPLEKVSETVLKENDNSSLVGNTFWDDAGRRGCRVCVVNPNIGYPPWRVNGMMIGRSSMTPTIMCNPKHAVDVNELEGLNQVRGLPRKGIRNLSLAIEQARNQIEKEFVLAERLLNKEKWHLFFTYSSVLDWVQHIFWAFGDSTSPERPNSESFRDTIREFYELYDRYVGRVFDKLDSDQVMIVLSDHGHGKRPMKLFNFNIMLNQAGMIRDKDADGARSALKGRMSQTAKGMIQRFVNEWDLGRPAAAVLKSFPKLRGPFVRAGNVDWNGTYAYVSDQSGLKAYSYGGVILRKDLISSKGLNYESVRSDVIRMLQSAVDESDGGRPIVRFAVRREQLYSGPNITKYPDVVGLLNEEYGFGWAASGPLMSSARTQNIMPGSHKIDSPILIISRKSPWFGMHTEEDPFRLEQFRNCIGNALGDDSHSHLQSDNDTSDTQINQSDLLHSR